MADVKIEDVGPTRALAFGWIVDLLKLLVSRAKEAYLGREHNLTLG